MPFETATKEVKLFAFKPDTEPSNRLQTLIKMHRTNKNAIQRIVSVSLSVCVLFIILYTGMEYIPNNVLVNFDHFEESYDVLYAMYLRFRNNIWVTLAAWLLPIVPALFIPLWVTELPLTFSSTVIGIICVASFISFHERSKFINMLITVPESGYMWYEVVVISFCSFFANPSHFWLLLGGPMVVVCAGPMTTTVSSVVFVVLAVLSIVFVLPTCARFVDEEGEFFLTGYSTDSLYGNALSIGLVHVWVRTYHIVCRDCYQTFVQKKSYRVLAVIWVLLGTALVELWVSSAWALHLAYSAVTRLKAEKRALDVLRRLFDSHCKRGCSRLCIA